MADKQRRPRTPGARVKISEKVTTDEAQAAAAATADETRRVARQVFDRIKAARERAEKADH